MNALLVRRGQGVCVVALLALGTMFALWSDETRTATALPSSPENMNSGTAPGDQDTDSPESIDLRNASRLDFGGFCIDQIPLGAITSVSRPEFVDDRQWRKVELNIPSDAPGQHPRIYLYSDIPTPALGYPDACANVKSRGEGVQVILDGQISRGRLKFVTAAPSGNYHRAVEIISSNDLEVVLAGAKSNFKPLYGGTISANNIRVVNVGRFSNLVRQGGGVSKFGGVLEVGSSKLQIANAKVRLPGTSDGSVFETNLLPGPDGASIYVTIPSGNVAFHHGSEVSQQLSDSKATATMSGAGISIAGTQWHIGKVELHANGSEKPQMILSNMKITAQHLDHGPTPLIRATPTAPVTVQHLAGEIPENADSAMPSAITVRGLVMTQASAIAMGGAAAAPAVSGVGSADVAEVSDTELNASLRVSAPVLSALAQATDVSSDLMTLHVGGKKLSPDLRGELSLTGASLGALMLAPVKNTSVAFKHSGVWADGELGIPFHVDTSTPQGAWTIQTPAGQVHLKGQIAALKASGAAWFGSVDKPARVVIDPGTFRIAASAGAAGDNLIFGAQAASVTISANLDLRSAEGFSIARSEAAGSVEVAVGLLTVANPQLAFDIDDPARLRISLPIQFTAGATLGISLADLKTRLLQGSARIGSAAATSMDPAVPMDLSGTKVWAPQIAFESLALDVADGIGTVKLTGLQANADKLDHPTDPAWSAKQAALGVASIDATLDEVGSALKLRDTLSTTFKVSGESGTYQSNDGFFVDGNGIKVEIASMSRQEVKGATIAIASGQVALNTGRSSSVSASAAYDNLSVSVDGKHGDINGSLHLHVTSIHGQASEPVLPGDCGDKLQVRIDVSAGAFLLDAAITHGTARGSAVLDDTKISMGKTGHDDCRWDHTYSIPVTRTVTESICWMAGPFSQLCEKVSKSVEVDVPVPMTWHAHVDKADAKIKADKVSVDLAPGSRNPSVCIRGAAVQPGAVISAPIIPELQVHNELTNKVWDAAGFVPGLVEGLIQSSLLNIASLLTNLFPVDRCL